MIIAFVVAAVLGSYHPPTQGIHAAKAVATDDGDLNPQPLPPIAEEVAIG